MPKTEKTHDTRKHQSPSGMKDLFVFYKTYTKLIQRLYTHDNTPSPDSAEIKEPHKANKALVRPA